MILSPDILAIPFAAVLAAAGPVCVVPEPPQIMVRPVSQDISYDYTKSAADLTRVKGDTASPYAAGTDSISGGLREDAPVITTKINWSVQSYTGTGQGCMWYKTIDVEIKLSPKIYVAREFNQGACREAILAHERRHVDTDRRIMNKYAVSIGKAIQAVVDREGVTGPFNTRDTDRLQKASSQRISQAVEAQEKLLLQEMAVLQGQVDSLEEYKRISAICRDVIP